MPHALPQFPPLPKAFLSLLSAGFSERDILTALEDCWAYGYDNSRRQVLPQAVVFPTTHGQVINLINACNKHGIPLTARGCGTGTTGATVPVKGGGSGFT